MKQSMEGSGDDWIHKGKITALFDRMCFIETAGVGYRVFITDIDHDELQTGEESRLYIHMAVREDAITLYGFLSGKPMRLFCPC